MHHSDIVSFKGEVFAMDIFERLLTIRLAPQLTVQEIATVWGDDMMQAICGIRHGWWSVVTRYSLLMSCQAWTHSPFEYSGLTFL
jgi:hypothetical protein